MTRSSSDITVVTPTYLRPAEAVGLLQNLGEQTRLPAAVIVVDGAPSDQKATEYAVTDLIPNLPFPCRYIRHGGGTAIQRNVGIQAANTEFIALVDDDIRLEPRFFEEIAAAFERDPERKVGAVVGYRTNQHFSADVQRWRWYRRLRLFTTYEPGRYDFESGYPINVNMQPPFTGVREIDFTTTSCCVWRREVFDSGLSFDPFFRDYGVLEDAHFSLRAAKTWKLWQCGDARCEHLHAEGGRPRSRAKGYKCVVNYYYVFQSVGGPLSLRRQFRFWRFQGFELVRVFSSGLRRGRLSDMMEFLGRIEGILFVALGSFGRQLNQLGSSER
jgi:GT2 family glycosyltransferase